MKDSATGEYDSLGWNWKSWDCNRRNWIRFTAETGNLGIVTVGIGYGLRLKQEKLGL